MIGKAKLLLRHLLIGKLDAASFKAVMTPLKLTGGREAPSLVIMANNAMEKTSN